MDDISIIGIIVATLAFFFLGAAWYTFLFGRPWRAELGISEEDAAGQKPMPILFVNSLVMGAIMATTLAWLIGPSTVGCGFKIGLFTGAGIGAALMAQNYAYEQKSLKFWAINASYAIVGLAVMGTIIGAFQAV